MFLFECPKNYQDMRKKIATSVFFMTLIEIFILAQISQGFSDLMKSLSFNTETSIFEIKLYVSYIYLPFVFSVLEYIFKVHDCIGKIFRIRDKFSASAIFIPYTKYLKINTLKNEKELKKLYIDNEDMRKIIGNNFYYYASSTEPKIDSHNISMALDSWCWFWIFLDYTVISLIFLIVVIFTDIFSKSIHFPKEIYIGFTIFLIIIILLTVLIIVFECKKYSDKEVEQIVKLLEKDQKKKEEFIKEIENCII